MTPRRPALRLALALAALAATACGAGEPADPDGPRTGKILLVTLDTLRADRLGCYGYARPTSPNLDRLASRSTRYTRAHAAAPWTLPAHATLFTGLYPLEHGAHTYPLAELPESERYNQISALESGQIAPLAPVQRTLAEALAGEGYATAAFVANAAYLSPRMGLDQGFAHYEAKRGRADEVNARALAWLDGVGERSFFLFLNYMDVHLPLNTRPQPALFPEPLPTASLELFEELYRQIVERAEPLDADKLRTFSDQYDLAVRNLDAGLGALFAELERRGLWDDLLVVITSDHGEFLGEKELLGHSKDVYEGTMGVPLIVKLPRQSAGRVVTEPVSQAHVPHLVLAHARGGARAAERFAAPKPADVLLGEVYYSRLRDLKPPWGARFDRVRRVLYSGDLKFIHSSDGAHELYDLAVDPREEHDLLTEDGADVEAWNARLGRLLAGLAPAPPRAHGPALDDEDLKNLRELGYAGEE